MTDPVGLIDVGPTLLSMVGLPAPPHSLGQSLVPLLQGSTSDRAIPTFRADGASIRKGRYRFTRTRDGNETLHDLVDDWWQQRDLGPGHPAHAGLARAFAEVCKDYGAAGLIPGGQVQ